MKHSSDSTAAEGHFQCFPFIRLTIFASGSKGVTNVFMTVHCFVYTPKMATKGKEQKPKVNNPLVGLQCIIWAHPWFMLNLSFKTGKSGFTLIIQGF